MISNQLVESITSIRRTDFGNSQEYSALQSYPTFNIEGSQYFQLLQLLLEEAERLQLKNTTKFMAKKYFDIYLSKMPQLDPSMSTLLIITCLRMATKFNQVVDVSEKYTLEYCSKQSYGQYSRDQFIECQIDLLFALQFRLTITTPYDFIFVKPLLPHLKQAMNILISIVDFSLSLPELRSASAEGIFFGALIYSCGKKNENPIVYDLIKAITFKWEEAVEIADILERNLERLLSQ